MKRTDGMPAAGRDYVADLRLDYEQTMVTWRMLVDTRFKLLALVPTVTGVVVAFAGRTPNGTTAVVAGWALTVLYGVVIYDLRNSVFHDAAVHRAKALERAMALDVLSDKGMGHGGLMNERPRDRYRLIGVQVWHDRGLYMVYSASAASLVGLLVLGVLAALGVPSGWRTATVSLAAVVAFAASLAALHHYDARIAKPGPPA